MYQVFKQVWNSGIASLQYIAEYEDLITARAKAKAIKGIVKINGRVCYDLTGYSKV
jgi:hypothetical protein